MYSPDDGYSGTANPNPRKKRVLLCRILARGYDPYAWRKVCANTNGWPSGFRLANA